MLQSEMEEPEIQLISNEFASISQREMAQSHKETFLNVHDTKTTMTTRAAFSSPNLEILKLQVPDSPAHSVGNRLQINCKTPNY